MGVCQRSSNHKLKAIHNGSADIRYRPEGVSKIVKSQIESNSQRAVPQIISDRGVSKIVKSQIESNSQLRHVYPWLYCGCVKDRQITNWKQFTTIENFMRLRQLVCQRSSNHKLKAIHNDASETIWTKLGVSKIVKSQIESNSQLNRRVKVTKYRCVKDRQITNWKQFTTHRVRPARRAWCVKDRQITNWKQFTT